MQPKKIYDLLAIGIGPFNLGLAALCYSIPELSCLFIEQNECFNWHAGMLLDNARLQVPFYADLVTLADPQSPFSYMAFLKAKERMFRFAIHENYFVTRKEYNQYCRWVADQLPNLLFNCRCEQIHYNGNEYVIQTTKGVFHAKHIVIGIGTVPALPACAEGLNHPAVVHSANYLPSKEMLLAKQSVTIIGSGQSAAEIFKDLLHHRENFTEGIHWFTKSSRFFPMEYSKLSLEMTSPDYIDHFYALPAFTKRRILAKQDMLYKGINYSLINEIYDNLYLQELDEPAAPVHLYSNCELRAVAETAAGSWRLGLWHSEIERNFYHDTGAIVLATGYSTKPPAFIESLHDRIEWDANNQYQVNRNYSIDANHTIFIQNAETHTHGFNAADLGMGPYRNAVIINSILGREHFSMESQIAFQTFGLPHNR